MDDTPITRPEYEEYKQKVEAENSRQNKRLELLEESVKQNGELTVSVQKLATNMESMLKEQEKQGKRLDSLEARDGEMWRNVCGYVATAVIGILIGFIFTQLGM